MSYHEGQVRVSDIEYTENASKGAGSELDDLLDELRAAHQQIAFHKQRVNKIEARIDQVNAILAERLDEARAGGPGQEKGGEEDGFISR